MCVLQWGVVCCNVLQGDAVFVRVCVCVCLSCGWQDRPFAHAWNVFVCVLWWGLVCCGVLQGDAVFVCVRICVLPWAQVPPQNQICYTNTWLCLLPHTMCVWVYACVCVCVCVCVFKKNLHPIALAVSGISLKCCVFKNKSATCSMLGMWMITEMLWFRRT